MKRIRKLSHPFMIASFPVLALYVENVGQVAFSVALRPWILSVLLAAVLVVLFRLVMRGDAKAAVAASITLVAFFSYGHIYEGLKQAGDLGRVVIRHRYLLPVSVGLTVAIFWRINRLDDLGRTPHFMNVIALVLVAQPLIRLTLFEVESAGFRSSVQSKQSTCSLGKSGTGAPRDIYLIIMDAYERDDVLLEMHGYDNTPFLEALESNGFYVARGSLSNYRHTEISLASLLNMDYIQNFPESYSADSNNRVGVVSLIRDSRLRRELECLGYSIVAFETGVVWTEWRDADYYISREAGFLYNLQLVGGLTRFESFLLRTTASRAAFDLSAKLTTSDEALSNDPIAVHRQRILFVFDQLQRVPEIPSPKFVFVHILSPHPPMVFGPNGENVNQAEFETDPTGQQVRRSVLDAYSDQVTFLNGKLLEVVTAIKEGSETPPIIIIQGDHGWADRDAEDKLSILNAYHLPGGANEQLYPTITPINTFRVIFNAYLGGGLVLLDDVSYFSEEEQVFEFEAIPNTWSADD